MKQKHDPSVLDIDRISVTYGSLDVLKDVSLAAKPGEFISLLGPSGSGKTTVLMSIAGFTKPSTGTIAVDGVAVNGMPPHRRRMGMVFQSYALFPHMSVARNIGYPMRIRREAAQTIDRKVAELLKLVHLDKYGDRMPAQLSGGQQQRVAIARALASDPTILLMDEPLSALDKKLREEMLIEIRRIHDEFGVTTIYVTHDQREALTISDRVAVMSGGRIVQIGSPQEIYDRPNGRFVADFIGEAAFLPAQVRNSAAFMENGTSLDVRGGLQDGQYLMVVRPERLSVVADRTDLSPGAVLLAGRLQRVFFQGETVFGTVLFEGQEVLFRCLNQSKVVAALPPVDGEILLALQAADITLVPKG
ncbi:MULTISPECIES: ABC transporter ATP-binding protein [Mesorhizobium]|uniref:ABC transporter ATP-binding protein n=1 Tax=Mesorhizobium TaxID=68287 RepID=UPI0010A958F4|nr:MULTISPECIES: ABC transporter ATP-binding protein [Mesorhizobium]